MPAKIQEDKYNRTFEELKKCYEAERELRKTLINASAEERKELYKSAYDNFFKKLPEHIMLVRKANPKAVAWVVEQRMKLLGQFLRPNLTFLEIGPGDCSLSAEIAKHVGTVYAVDVSDEITRQKELPANLKIIISDGCSIPVEKESVDLAFSHQLIEHLHPDDAIEQLQNVYESLAHNGKYICITPNRLSGPHDDSQYFEEVATGWHLKEYTVGELYSLFDEVGFTTINYYKSWKKYHVSIPLNSFTVFLVGICENTLEKLPFIFKRKSAKLLLFRGITIVGIK